MTDDAHSPPVALVGIRAGALQETSTGDRLLVDLVEDSEALRRLRVWTPPPDWHARIGAPGEPGHQAGFDAATILKPQALWLRLNGAEALLRLDARLAVVEALHGFADGGIGIVVEVAAAAAALQLDAMLRATPRVRGVFWNPSTGDPASSPTRTARDLCLVAAAAAGVPAYDRAQRLANAAALRRDCAAAARMGFAGRVTGDAADAAVIRAAFSGA